MIDETNKVLDGLTDIIMTTLYRQRREEYTPGFDADNMDDTIKRCKERVKLMRYLRESFEDEMSRPV